MKRIFESMLKEKGYMHFFAIIAIYWLVSYVTSEFIVTDSFLYNSFYDSLPEQYIDKAIAFNHKWVWVTYITLPIILILKWLFISAFIATGSIFMGYNLKFSQILKITMICEWLFVLVGVANFIVLLFANVQNLEEVQHLNLNSMLSIGLLIQGIDGLDWLVKPLQLLNIFQLIFIFSLSLGVSVVSKETFANNFKMVSKSYSAALIIWIVLITYISISYA